jgi:NADH-quinone oxidoreductase subunit N
MLVGVLAGPLAAPQGFGTFGDGTSAVLYYMVVYGLANLAAFAILGLLRTQGRPCETLRDLAGLIRRQPGLALLMALAMFTLMGLPPTPGFWGKVGLFGSAITAAREAVLAPYGNWLIALVIIGVLNSALAAAYYLRVIAAVLLYDNEQPAYASAREAPQIGALLCGFLLLIFMFYPNALLAQGKIATTELIQRVELVLPAPPGAELTHATPAR